MLGVFLIFFMVLYLLVRVRIWFLFRDDHSEDVELNAEGHTYSVCRRVVRLRFVLNLIMLIGYLGCMWPALFVDGLDLTLYIFLAVMLIGGPIIAFAFYCYYSIKGEQHEEIQISSDEIEHKGRKEFTVKVSDIKRVECPSMNSCRIHLKAKGKEPLGLYFSNYYKKKEISSLLMQLRECCAKINGRDTNVAHKFGLSKLDYYFAKGFSGIITIVIVFGLLYSSYCCIDYDFFMKDYALLFSEIGFDPNEEDNAWEYYVSAAGDYKELDTEFQKQILKGLGERGPELSDEQIDLLNTWFNDNAFSWESLKTASSIDYCNALCENTFFYRDPNDDFSIPSEVELLPICKLYANVGTGQTAGIFDIDWFDLFDIEVESSRHLINGKTHWNYSVGYILLATASKHFAMQDSYEVEDLQKARVLLDNCFPKGIRPLNFEGDVFAMCHTFQDMINVKKIPVQSPLNPAFLMFGSVTGAERYLHSYHASVIKQISNGDEVRFNWFSINNLPITRTMLISSFNKSIANFYKRFQKAEVHLSVLYVMLDLEGYFLKFGRYPVDVGELRRGGFVCELPDDPDGDGKIVYRNDGDRAVLYGVGANGVDDGGFRGEKGVDGRRDDLVFWERD